MSGGSIIPTDESTKNEFQYFVSTKGPFSIVVFYGIMNNRAENLLKNCIDEISKLDVKHIILNFHTLTKISGDGFQQLTHMQQVARHKSTLRLCGINPEIMDALRRRGLVRQSEILDSLKTAVLEIQNFNKR